MEEELIPEPPTINDPIALSQEEKARLYDPWRFSIIVKLFARRISHLTLKAKLNELWKREKNLILIDLEWDFFIVKFNLEKSMTKALHGGL